MSTGPDERLRSAVLITGDDLRTNAATIVHDVELHLRHGIDRDGNPHAVRVLIDSTTGQVQHDGSPAPKGAYEPPVPRGAVAVREFDATPVLLAFIAGAVLGDAGGAAALLHESIFGVQQMPGATAAEKAAQNRRAAIHALRLAIEVAGGLSQHAEQKWKEIRELKRRLKAMQEKRAAVPDDIEAVVAKLVQDRVATMYRDTWSFTETYAAGDLVTHDGSLWIAKAVSTGIRPGTSEAWRLAVKRGQDRKRRVS